MSETPDSRKRREALRVGRWERIQTRAQRESKAWEAAMRAKAGKTGFVHSEEEKPHHHIPAFKEAAKKWRLPFYMEKAKVMGTDNSGRFRLETRKTFRNENTEPLE